MNVAFDLDGVLVDCEWYAREYITRLKDWDAYFGLTLSFRPVAPMVNLLQTFIRGSRDDVVYFVTGRPEHNRILTEAWLRRYALYGLGILLMRPDGDQRRNYELKLEYFKSIKPDLIFEDDPEAVREIIKAGYVVVQVHGFRYSGHDLVPPIKE